MSECLLIRADASARMGTGHVMRCLALAQAWRRNGGSAIFASAEMTDALKTRLVGAGFQCMRLAVTPGTRDDAAITGEMAKSQDASWVVADGYGFGLDYQRAVKAAGLRLLFLDDYGHAGEYVADFVLNQNLTPDPALYARRSPHTRLLLGTQYVLLREEFLRWRNWKREIPAIARKVLVTLGGADPDNVTGKVIEALRGLDVEAKIVVGGSNSHLEQLRSQVSSLSPQQTGRKLETGRLSRCELVVDSQEMPALMAWADVAIAAGGTTSWELAFMGLPSVMIVLADNQRALSEIAERSGLGRSLGWHADLTPKEIAAAILELAADRQWRERISKCGRRMMDGLGTTRVVRLLTGSSDSRVIADFASDLNVETPLGS